MLNVYLLFFSILKFPVVSKSNFVIRYLEGVAVLNITKAKCSL